MIGDDGLVLAEESGKCPNPDSDFENLSDSDPSISCCSTSESGMSNTFLDEIFMGHYDGWDREHNCWLGRWVKDAQIKKLLYSLQTFQFLDLPKFLSEPMPRFKPESFAAGTRHLDDFLACAERDIVGPNKRFPEGAYHFIDDNAWTKTINGLYTALEYIQEPDMNLCVFYNLWIDAIVPAIETHLLSSMTRERFEKDHELRWCDPSLERATSSSSDSDSKGLNLEPIDASTDDLDILELQDNLNTAASFVSNEPDSD